MDLAQLPRHFIGGHLRRLQRSDLIAFQTYRSLPELGRYQGWLPLSDAEALEFIDEMSRAPLFQRGQWLQLGIAEPKSDALVGDIGLHVSDDGTFGEVGVTLQPSAQGCGIASRAVREAVQLLFAATGIAQVLGVVDARNERSIRLLERTGFKFVERRNVVFRGEPCTERVYALCRNDGQPFV